MLPTVQYVVRDQGLIFILLVFFFGPAPANTPQKQGGAEGQGVGNAVLQRMRADSGLLIFFKLLLFIFDCARLTTL